MYYCLILLSLKIRSCQSAEEGLVLCLLYHGTFKCFTMGKGKLILFDVSLLKKKYVSIKNIGSLIKFRCNSVSINEVLLELLRIYLIVVVQSWKSTTLKMMNGITDVYICIRSTIKLLKSEYFAIRIHFTGSVSQLLLPTLIFAFLTLLMRMYN